jgi:predicted transcriptional regulator
MQMSDSLSNQCERDADWNNNTRWVFSWESSGKVHFWKLLDMSQKELARLAGVSQSMIAKIENTRISPSYTKTKSIFDTLENLERRNELKAKDVSHIKVASVQGHDLLAKGIRVMRETGFSQLPVLNGGQVVGSLTEKIILEKLFSAQRPEEVSKQTVEKVMDDSFPMISEETPLSMVSAMLQYSPAVLVTRKGHVQGIITKADLLKVVGA